MPDVQGIREAIAANLGTIDGFHWSAYRLSNATPPCGFVWVAPFEFDAVMHRGGDFMSFMVTVYAALTTDIGSAMVLQRVMNPDGPFSVKAAVEADRTLGGLVDDLRVTDCAGENVYVLEGKGSALGTDFTVQVLT